MSESANTTPITLGECRVRTRFNVGGNEAVTEIKSKSAELINVLDQLRSINYPGTTINPEKERLISLAQTAYEEASMWAVKAITF